MRAGNIQAASLGSKVYALANKVPPRNKKQSHLSIRIFLNIHAG